MIKILANYVMTYIWKVDELLRLNCKDVLLVSPEECKLFLMFLVDKREEKTFFTSTTSYKELWDIIICVANETTWIVAATIGGHQSVKFKSIYCHSLRSIFLLCVQNRHVDWVCDGNHHSCVFQVFDDSIDLCIPFRSVVLLFNLLFSEEEALLFESTWSLPL